MGRGERSEAYVDTTGERDLPMADRGGCLIGEGSCCAAGLRSAPLGVETLCKALDMRK